ncbi:MAG: hypothetical protein AABY22_26840, partial [Nanoarchaeota archaeon]
MKTNNKVWRAIIIYANPKRHDKIIEKTLPLFITEVSNFNRYYNHLSIRIYSEEKNIIKIYKKIKRKIPRTKIVVQNYDERLHIKLAYNAVTRFYYASRTTYKGISKTYKKEYLLNAIHGYLDDLDLGYWNEVKLYYTLLVVIFTSMLRNQYHFPRWTIKAIRIMF